MEIRYLTEKDDPLKISGIYESSWKYAYKDIIPGEYLDSIPSGKWADNINKPGRENLIVTENGEIIGTASFGRSRWENYSGYGEIISIYFLPEYMEKGYGMALLERCTRELSKKGFDRVLLWVLEENAGARKFYEKCGFVCSGEFMYDSIGGKDLREVLYLLDINSKDQ